MTLEDRAHDYLVRVAGRETADWARRENNGTWTRALELMVVSDMRREEIQAEERPETDE